MNYKIILIFTGVILLFSNCKNEKPDLSIKENKLLEVFYDMHTAGYIISRSPDEKTDSLKKLYIDQICKIHNIDKYEFLNNVSKIESNPKYFKTFYEKLEVYSDSIKKINNKELNK